MSPTSRHGDPAMFMVSVDQRLLIVRQESEWKRKFAIRYWSHSGGISSRPVAARTRAATDRHSERRLPLVRGHLGPLGGGRAGPLSLRSADEFRLRDNGASGSGDRMVATRAPTGRFWGSRPWGRSSSAGRSHRRTGKPPCPCRPPRGSRAPGPLGPGARRGTTGSAPVAPSASLAAPALSRFRASVPLRAPPRFRGTAPPRHGAFARSRNGAPATPAPCPSARPGRCPRGHGQPRSKKVPKTPGDPRTVA